jgi:hypothetical protein
MNMNPSDPNSRRDGEEPTAPAKLVAALKEPPSRRVFVPPSVDAAVLAAARRQIAPRSQSRLQFFRNWLSWPAFAGAIVVVVSLAYLLSRPDETTRFAREDVNHDGQVDILDALQLAREARSGDQSAEHDMNGDGQVDGRDADFIAARAVQLEKAPKS